MDVLYKKLFLKISQYSQENIAALLKRDFNTGVFFVNIVKFLRTAILKKIGERLLLSMDKKSGK